MAREPGTYSLSLAPCGCAPGRPAAGGAEPEFYGDPLDAALAAKRHAELGDRGWAVHYVGPWPDSHVALAVVGGVRYAPGKAAP